MHRFLFSILLLLLACSLSLNVYWYFQLALERKITTHQPQLPTLNKTAIKQSKNTVKSQTSSQTQPLDHHQISQTQVNQLFDNQQFEQAVVLYEELLSQNEVAAMAVKRYWHQRLQAMLQQKALLSIDNFMAVYTDSFAYDIEFLTIQADALAAEQKIDQAIALFNALISYSFETRQEEYFQARIHHLANEQLALFKQGLAWQAIIDFSDSLMQQEPDHPPYILAQAEAYVYLEDFNAARQLLTPMLEISFYRARAQALINKINQSQLQQTAVKLQPIGEHYLVEGHINDANPIRLMIDTGASISVLTRARFDEIQHWTSPLYIGETLLNTAGGQINAPIYQFDSFQIDEFIVDNISFVVLDLDNMDDYHGLLGMNFLKQFKFQIDQASNLLILSP